MMSSKLFGSFSRFRPTLPRFLVNLFTIHTCTPQHCNKLCLRASHSWLAGMPDQVW